MTFEEEIYFSRNHEWKSINLDKPLELVAKFDDRVRTIYLDQASILLNNENSFYNSFSAGVILFSAIEWVGSFLTKHNGFKNKLDEFLKYSKDYTALELDEREQLSKKITECFRNGIIHNGRVKDACQFDYNFDEKLFASKENFLIVNTKPLHDLVVTVLNHYIEILNKDELILQQFLDRFKNEFDVELKKLVS
ncbi:MAG: hypothetical protein JNL53_13935 [Cyclobacteriaceae bacterium]|nr:hypothetical protein [Cyclobacteriaceae bacterium]